MLVYLLWVWFSVADCSLLCGVCWMLVGFCVACHVSRCACWCFCVLVSVSVSLQCHEFQFFVRCPGFSCEVNLKIVLHMAVFKFDQARQQSKTCTELHTNTAKGASLLKGKAESHTRTLKRQGRVADEQCSPFTAHRTPEVLPVKGKSQATQI